MSDFVFYSVIVLLSCFSIAYYCLNKIDADLIPESYELSLDPFWSIWGTMLVGGCLAFHFYPDNFDMIMIYKYTTFIIPLFFALLVYICYLFEQDLLSNVLMFIGGLVVSYMAPDDYMLFPEIPYLILDKILIAVIIFVIAKSFMLLNGLPGVASIQALTILLSIFLLSYFGALPQVLAVVAMAYFGAIIAFAFFSWPPEKLILSQGAFSALGFIIVCLMFDASVEYAESSMLVASSYLITELLVFIYNRYLLGIKKTWGFMNTIYFKLSNEGEFTNAILSALYKIMIVNIILSIAQIYCYSRIAFPIFSVLANFWFLAILAGEAEPLRILSISRMGVSIFGGLLRKKQNNKIDKEK